jgi:hypothetical protein
MKRRLGQFFTLVSLTTLIHGTVTSRSLRTT